MAVKGEGGGGRGREGVVLRRGCESEQEMEPAVKRQVRQDVQRMANTPQCYDAHLFLCMCTYTSVK